MNNLKDKVKHCLSKSPHTRNSDVALTLAVWLEFYSQKFTVIDNSHLIDVKYLFELPREDHISRIRRIIQNNDGMYLPTSLKVVKARKINETKWEDYMRNAINPNPATG